MMSQLTTTYAGKKVLLTGHTGFKGSWLLKILSILGAEVRGYSLAPENELNLYDLINGNTLCDSIISNILDKQALMDAVVDFQPDFIFHLAAQPLVRLSYKLPAETFEVNTIGTANLLNAVNTLEQACSVILITTDKVYHNNEWVYPYRENDRLGGYDPYSASKACAELVIDSYRNSFFNPNSFNRHKKAVAVCRAGNVIGGGDWSADRLIPDIVKGLVNDKKIEIRNPDSVRPWQHVLEPLTGYLLLGAKLFEDPRQFSQPYNFGPEINDALPVSKMVDIAIKYWGAGQHYTKPDVMQPHEAGLLKLDISKAKEQLGWTPKLAAEQAVELTINWYKEFHNNGNMVEYTNGQIEEFLNG